MRLLAFAPCVLAHPGHGEKIAEAISKRAREWRSSNDAWIRMFELRSLQSRKRHTRSRGAGGPGDVFDDTLLPRGFESSYGFKTESMTKIPEVTKERVISLARDGQYSKAVSAEVLPRSCHRRPTYWTAYASFTPQPTHRPFHRCHTSIADPTRRELRKLLRSFPIGSSGGIPDSPRECRLKCTCTHGRTSVGWLAASLGATCRSSPARGSSVRG